MWAKKVKGTLFVPPTEVQTRHDTIDDLLAADRAHLTPGKRALLIGATLATSAGSLGGNNLLQVTQVWGQQDVYSGTRQTAKTDAAE